MRVRGGRWECLPILDDRVSVNKARCDALPQLRAVDGDVDGATDTCVDGVKAVVPSYAPRRSKSPPGAAGGSRR